MIDHWSASARLVARLLRCLAPARVADAVLRDIDEGYRRRRRTGGRGCERWLLRQLLLTLRPARLLELRRMETRVIRDHEGPWTRAGRTLTGLGADLRYAVRLVAGTPAFSALTVTVLAGGLGVSIFTFSFLHTAAYAPLPIPGGESVVRVMGVRDGRMSLLDAVDFRRLRDELDSFEILGAYDTRYVLVRGDRESRPIYGTFIEPNMFDVAPVEPLLGRRLLPADAQPGAEPVAVLGYGLWASSFGASPDVVGRLADLNGVSTRIVGVMPKEFGFPVWGELWLPLDRESLEPYERGLALNVYGKLRPGISFARADAELRGAIVQLRADVVDADALDELPDTAVVRTFQKAQLGDEADLFLVTVHMAAAFILLLACVNAGNLLLSRCLERDREIAVRMALGAPRLRLVRQMMAEGSLIALLAGGIGLGLAGVALAVFDEGAHAALPDGLAYWWRWGLDGPALIAAAVLVAATVLLVGGVPAWRATRADAYSVLRDGPQPGEGRHAARLSRALVTAQVALIAVLLFLGGMTGVIAYRAADFDRGLDSEGVLVGSVDLEGADLDVPLTGAESRVALLERLHERLQASTAVEGALIRARLGAEQQPLRVEGRAYETEAQQPRAQLRATLGDPALIGIRVVAGRLFDDRDGAGGEPVTIVSASLARELWGGASPLGKRIRVGSVEEEGPADSEPWRVVVGVASDILEGNPVGRDRNYRTEWVPLAQVAPTRVEVTFRHRGDVRAAIGAFHEALAEVAPGVIPERVLDFDEILGTMEMITRTFTDVLGGCFAFALLLAVGGIYGLTARSVVRRRQEVGIRRALGASDARIVSLFLRGGGAQLAVGLGIAALIGGALSVAASRFLELGPLLFASAGLGVATLISALVLAATYLPTRGAVRLTPREAIWPG